MALGSASHPTLSFRSSFRIILMTRLLRSRRSASSVRRSPYSKIPSPTVASAQAVEVLPPLRQMSSRTLDMCLLAVCSCALSLMFHQTSGLLNMPSVTSSSAMTPTSSGAAQVDFIVKAGLVTSRQEAGESEQEE